MTPVSPPEGVARSRLPRWQIASIICLIMTKYRPRSLGPAVREALEEMPVVVMTGLRQTGKSTFLQREAGLADRLYVSLDDFAQMEAARRDPESFVQRDEPLT